jgi:hypothetical protein
MDEEEVYYELCRIVSDRYGTEAAERADESLAAAASEIAGSDVNEH